MPADGDGDGIFNSRVDFDLAKSGQLRGSQKSRRWGVNLGQKSSHEVGTYIHQGYITRRQVDTTSDSYIQYIPAAFDLPAPSPATYPHSLRRQMRRRIFGKKMGEKSPSPSPFAEPGCVAFWPQRRNIDGPILRYILIRNQYLTYVGFVPVLVGGDWQDRPKILVVDHQNTYSRTILPQRR